MRFLPGKNWLTSVAIVVALALLGCGEEEQTDFGLESDPEASTSVAPVRVERSAPERRLVEIPINLQSSSELALGLTAPATATSYEITVANCLSGYTETGIAASTIYVYEYDQSCTAQVTQIVFGTVTYDLTHPDAVAWNGTAAGSVATLVATTAGGVSTDEERLEVVIDSTFSATVQGADTLDFSFRQFVRGTPPVVAVSVVDNSGNAVTVSGNRAPNFTIESITLQSLDGAAGFGVWEFRLLCGNALTAGNTLCDDVLLTDISYTLILDTFGGSEPTRANLQDALDGNAPYTLSSGIAVIAGDVNNTSGPDNGGFSTRGTSGTTYVSLANSTRTNIHSDPNMILVVEANGAFRYFHVDLTQVSN